MPVRMCYACSVMMLTAAGICGMHQIFGPGCFNECCFVVEISVKSTKLRLPYLQYFLKLMC